MQASQPYHPFQSFARTIPRCLSDFASRGRSSLRRIVPRFLHSTCCMKSTLAKPASRMSMQIRLYTFVHPLLSRPLRHPGIPTFTHLLIDFNFTGWNEWVTPFLVLTTHPALAPGGQLLTAPGANQATCWLNRHARIARAQCFHRNDGNLQIGVCTSCFSLEKHQVAKANCRDSITNRKHLPLVTMTTQFPCVTTGRWRKYAAMQALVACCARP